MNEVTPRRRGRPPLVSAPLEEVAASPTKRRRRAPLNGIRLKLDAPQRPGFFRRWFVDKPGRLAEAAELAYDHVSEPGLQSDGTDSRVRRLTGTDGFGAPQYSYLMETPLEEYQAGAEDKEAALGAFESAILRGADPEGKLSDAYGRGDINGSFKPG